MDARLIAAAAEANIDHIINTCSTVVSHLGIFILECRQPPDHSPLQTPLARNEQIRRAARIREDFGFLVQLETSGKNGAHHRYVCQFVKERALLKRPCVLGGASGIGRQVAMRYVHEGYGAFSVLDRCCCHLPLTTLRAG